MERYDASTAEYVWIGEATERTGLQITYVTLYKSMSEEVWEALFEADPVEIPRGGRLTTLTIIVHRVSVRDF